MLPLLKFELEVTNIMSNQEGKKNPRFPDDFWFDQTVCNVHYSNNHARRHTMNLLRLIFRPIPMINSATSLGIFFFIKYIPMKANLSKTTTLNTIERFIATMNCLKKSETQQKKPVAICSLKLYFCKNLLQHNSSH